LFDEAQGRVCGHCGSRLKTHITSNAGKTRYFYYVRPKRRSNRDNGTCPNAKAYRAEALQLLVRDILLDTPGGGVGRLR